MATKPTIAPSAGDGNETSIEARGLRKAMPPASPMPTDSWHFTVECHENDIPDFVEAELERLHGHIFSSLAHFRAYGGLAGQISTYVLRDAGKAVCILLFRREASTVHVINQGLRLGAEDIDRFAAHIFATHAEVGLITLHAVDSRSPALRYPHQCFACTEDIVISLPATVDAYLAGLGKNMRRNLRRYMDRLQRSFPSYSMEFFVEEEVDEAAVRKIIEFNRARMAGKRKVSTLDAQEADRIVSLARSCGMVGVARIDGEICAGAIGYRIGENYFLYVIAHDPKYDAYWLGILSCYLTIRECIARGWKELHFLWGRYEYKFSLGAVRRDLSQIAIYRSRLHMLRRPGMVLRTARDGYVQHIRSALLDSARQPDSFPSRIAFHALNHLRKLKRSAAALFADR